MFISIIPNTSITRAFALKEACSFEFFAMFIFSLAFSNVEIKGGKINCKNQLKKRINLTFACSASMFQEYTWQLAR